MMEAKDLNKYVKKSVKVFLDDGYKYEGYVVNFSNGWLTLLDKKVENEILLNYNKIRTVEVIE